MKGSYHNLCVSVNPAYKSEHNFYFIIVFVLGDHHTLGDLLKHVVPEIMEDDRLSRSWRLIIQGIEPPLETPLQWLSEHLSHPDNFLHVCVLNR